MASDAVDVSDAAPTPPARRTRVRWWKEVGYIVAFYLVYSFVRNRFGSAAVSPQQAFENAELIIDIQKAMGLYVEEAIQQAFIEWRLFIRFWNIFYGTFHFIVTAAALLLLYRRTPGRYRLWRTTLACTTALALVGFAAFPLMPPRLLPTIDPSYDYVDTLATIGGWWSFDSEAMKKVSNQYAAMPSLHFGWSTWSACVLFPLLRSRWARALAVLYPLATVFAIVVTANHFWLDAVGGAVVLGLGYLLARLFVNRVPDPIDDAPPAPGIPAAQGRQAARVGDDDVASRT